MDTLTGLTLLASTPCNWQTYCLRNLEDVVHSLMTIATQTSLDRDLRQRRKTSSPTLNEDDTFNVFSQHSTDSDQM